MAPPTLGDQGWHRGDGKGRLEVIEFSPAAVGPGGALHSSHEAAGPLTPRKPEPALTPRAPGGRRPGPARRREPPPPIRPGPLHPTRQGPSPSASPWWASRPRHVSIRDIMPPRGRGPGLDMSVWISPPTPRNADAVRDACRLRHSDPRPGRSSRGQGPSPGTPLSGAGGVGRDDGPPRVTPSAMPPGGPVARPARWGRNLSSHPPRAPPWPSCFLDSLTADAEPLMPDDIAP